MKLKTITLLFSMMLLQIATSAQTTVHYEYDEAGNRETRWIQSQPVAPPQSNTNNPTVEEDINSLIKADNLSEIGENANASGIAALTEGDIKVFPNPVQKKLNVQFNGTAKAEGCSLQLFDGAGRVFYKKAALKNHTEINMQQAQSGTYFLVVVAKDGKRLYWKLVKE